MNEWVDKWSSIKHINLQVILSNMFGTDNRYFTFMLSDNLSRLALMSQRTLLSWDSPDGKFDQLWSIRIHTTPVETAQCWSTDHRDVPFRHLNCTIINHYLHRDQPPGWRCPCTKPKRYVGFGLTNSPQRLNNWLWQTGYASIIVDC